MNLPADPASDAMMKYAHGVVRTPPHSIGGRHFAQKSGCASDFWQTAHPGTDLLMAAYDCTTGTARSSRRLSHPLPVRTRSALSGRYRYSSMWALLTGDVVHVSRLCKASPIVPTEVKDRTDRVVPINLRATTLLRVMCMCTAALGITPVGHSDTNRRVS